MDAKKLEEICIKHIKWINNEDGGERANLYGANLYGANMSGVNLYQADLSGAENADYAKAQTVIVTHGSIIGWKKAKCETGDCIIKLRIPDEAKRSNASGRKCRAEYADVLEIIGAEKAWSWYDRAFIYEAGKRVTANNFDDNRFNECSAGIHFFITREEAEGYSL